ncbi:hypothetical protein ACFFRR_002603 [Megaselia abdita]
MGEAVPMVQEDSEVVESRVESVTKTTTDNALSTWILLNNVASSTTTPRPTTTLSTTTKKLTKKPQFQLKSTLKPVLKTTTLRPENKDKPTIIRKNKNTKKPTPSPTSVSTTLSIVETKPTKKPTTTTTTTTFRPTVESTTFLILEPKDADFDLPQDRSPGTTKKPKRKPALTKGTNSKKKNQVKVAGEKKPTKGAATKDKPLSTKIYNYLAREVMPTVGVGLVGLTVAAGLATYFLGPFGALRRSYDNASDRKDDFYHNNDDEYGGSGQSEEEVFGKVIAGMPANSPYRNSMKYNAYHRNNQPMQRPSNAAGIRIVQAPPQHYRVRNSGYVPNHMPSYMSTKRNDDRTQIYRYNSEPNGMSYQPQKAPEVSLTTSVPLIVTDSTTQSSYFPAYSSSSPENLEIVTPQSAMEDEGDLTKEKPANHKYPSADIPDSNNNQQMDNNVLKKRINKYVVGTVVDANNEDNDLLGEMPEHGPRRRRQATGNELDAVLPVEEPGYIFEEISITEKPEEAVSAEPDSKVTETTTLSTESAIKEEVKPRPSTSRPPVLVTVEVQSPRPNIFELVKSLFEFKLRMGLNFLQQTTQNFQRVLKQVEKSVDESKFFNRNATMTSRTPRPRTTTTKQPTTTTKQPISNE